MGEKGETPQPQDYDSSSPKDPLDDSLETRPHGGGHHHHHLHRRHHHHQHHDSSLIVATPFISTPLYHPTTTPNTAPFEAVNPKRTRYTAGQWKLLPSPTTPQPPIPVVGSDSSPSPSQRPAGTSTVAAASSSDTTSSPSHSPLPAGSKGEGESQNQPQYRKGKYVSPVWKPNEMLWLARAWRVQYQGGTKQLLLN